MQGEENDSHPSFPVVEAAVAAQKTGSTGSHNTRNCCGSQGSLGRHWGLTSAADQREVRKLVSAEPSRKATKLPEHGVQALDRSLAGQSFRTGVIGASKHVGVIAQKARAN